MFIWHQRKHILRSDFSDCNTFVHMSAIVKHMFVHVLVVSKYFPLTCY